MYICPHNQRRRINQIARISYAGLYRVVSRSGYFSVQNRGIFCSNDNSLLTSLLGVGAQKNKTKKGQERKKEEIREITSMKFINSYKL